jgi:hypothetical protein
VSNGIWSIITLVGLAGWISSMLVFLFKAFPGRDQFEARSARTWGLAVLVSYGIWIAGMLNA